MYLNLGTHAIVSRVTSAKSGPRMISWMALSVSRSTAEVAKTNGLGNAFLTEDKMKGLAFIQDKDLRFS